MRIYEATAPLHAAGMKLEKYVSLALPLLPAHVVREAFNARDVKMDQVRAGRDAQVVPGAVIQVYTSFDISLPAVYEDDHVLLINKPAGITCETDEWGGMSVLSLAECRAEGVYQPRLCHRLDHLTSGLMLLCKDDESEKLLLDMFRERRLTKVYQCLVRGEMRPPAALKEAYLIKDAARSQVRIVTHDTPGALPIATRYETLSFDGTVSRLRVTLLTGRTHQIRAHMSFLSHPILGDDKYGDRALNRRMRVSGLKLCATELVLYPGGALSYLDGKLFTVSPPF